MAFSSRHIETRLPTGGPQSVGVTAVTESGSAEVLSFTGGSPGYQTKTITAVTETGSAEILIVAPRGLVHISHHRGGIYPNGGLSAQSLNFSPSGTTENSRIKHICHADANGIRLLYCNGADDTTTGGVGTVTIKAGLEDSGGTIEAVKWSGVDHVDIAVGEVILSDICTTTLDAGETFWVRTFTTVASGDKYPLIAQTQSGDGEGKNGSASNFAHSGTITASANKCFTAEAIVGNSDTACIAVLGDSIDVGGGSSQPAVGYIGISLVDQIPHVRMAMGGEAAYQFLTDNAERTEIIETIAFTDVIVGYVPNDMRDGRTVAQMKASLSAIYALFPDANVWAATRPPWSVTSTDHYVTVANQTRTEAADANRTEMMDWIRAGADGLLAGYFDTGPRVEATENPHVWACPGGAALTADGIHPNFQGHTLMAAAVDTDVFGEATPQTVSIIEVSEVGEAIALSHSTGGSQNITLDPVLEDGAAWPLLFEQAQQIALVAVTETGEAQSLFLIHNKTISPATETGVAQPLTYSGSASTGGGLEQIISQLGAEKKIDEPRVYTLP